MPPANDVFSNVILLLFLTLNMLMISVILWYLSFYGIENHHHISILYLYSIIVLCFENARIQYST
jgi:hypothetical protein